MNENFCFLFWTFQLFSFFFLFFLIDPCALLAVGLFEAYMFSLFVLNLSWLLSLTLCVQEKCWKVEKCGKLILEDAVRCLQVQANTQTKQMFTNKKVLQEDNLKKLKFTLYCLQVLTNTVSRRLSAGFYEKGKVLLRPWSDTPIKP